jgi:DNA polymerase-3 subunit alpha
MTSAGTDFVHLRVHSDYSLLAAPCTIDGLVQAAKADGQTALALTDSGNLFGAIEFYKSCKAAGLQAILGMAAFCAGRTRREPTSPDNQSFDLTLLAVGDAGWRNLRLLSSKSWLDGFHYRPRIDRELLAEHREGLIVLSGGISSELGRAFLQDDARSALATAGWFAETFGRDHYYLELAENGSDPQRRVNEGLRALAQRLDLQVAATNDVHYLRPEDWVVQDVLTCIQNGHLISDPNRFRMASHELYLKSRAEMLRAFAALPQATANTVAIAERCKVQIEFGCYHLPVFRTGTDETPEALFDRLCQEGARTRYGTVGDAVRERLAHETAVIKKLGFVSYFLIVWDFIRHARRQGVPVGPGRGSAAGSIVAYVLGITDVDPLRYHLIFERFLNVARVSMPDIDVDFCGERRDEVIRYVREKYGDDNVCQIVTFGTMASRGVLRDVGRVLEMPLADVDKLCKKVPQGPGASLAKALESDPELKALAAASEANKRLFDLGRKLEGLARHTSIHAAGVVIADRPLLDYVPLCRSADEIVTQWQMNELEDVGLLKMDFLGLKTLTILVEAGRLIEQRGVTIDLDAIPLDDAATFQLMTRGETLGVFQLESSGMRELLARLRPDTFEDVIAVLALYRPGPLGSGMVDMFVRRKHGEEPVEYPHACLAPILEETYGVIVYQEQVMRIANVLAGFPMSTADELRKAMGKKKPEVMARFRDQFVAGAGKNGHEAKFARDLFDTIEYFAGYGFNKSHSTAYALLTFRTAWLKAHHPVEFLAANLTIESGNVDKVKEFVDEARRMGVAVRPPDVNRSERRFSVEDGAVRYGLGALRGVGTRAADLIAEHRASGGPFTSLENLCERVDGTVANKATLEALARAGGFDGLGTSRRGALEQLDAVMRGAAAAREDRRRGQGFLFGTAPAPGQAERGPEWSEAERLANEKEALGFYLSGHPFEKRGVLYARLAGCDSVRLKELAPGTEVRLAGMISGVKLLTIKSGRNAGQKMAKFHLEDLHGSVPVTCFARVYAEVKDLLIDDSIVFVRGRVDAQAEETSLLLDEIATAQQVLEREVAELIVELKPADLEGDLLDRLARLAETLAGNHPLVLIVRDGERTYRIRAARRFAVRIDEDAVDKLAALVGAENLRYTRR